MTTDNFCFYLQNRLIQTSQTGGQQYTDTSPFNIPCLVVPFTIKFSPYFSRKPSQIYKYTISTEFARYQVLGNNDKYFRNLVKQPDYLPNYAEF
jgi:hypothetical protein